MADSKVTKSKRRPSPRQIHSRYSLDLHRMYQEAKIPVPAYLLEGLTCEVLEKFKKTSSLTVKAKHLIVSVPVGTSKDWIEAWLIAQSSWLQKQLSPPTSPFYLPIKVEQGGEVPFLGESYQVNWSVGSKAHVALAGRSIELTLSPRSRLPEQQQAKNLLKRFLREQANDRLARIFACWVDKLSAAPTDLRISDFKARWGSCSYHGEVALNWRLIHASEWMIDYVVVHELCHLKHFNHSNEFWCEVEVWFPNWKAAKKQFDVNGDWLRW